MSRRLWCLGLVVFGLGPTARAQVPQSKLSPPQVNTHELKLRAGSVELDGDLRKLQLSHSVELRVHRYWLAAEELRLERKPTGVEVEGRGRMALCPCADPPVTLGFSRAVVAPPTDLLLRDATCRVGGVPVAWLPAVWLRSPHRLGLLPPRFAYRAKDGTWVGSGVHVPLSGTSVREAEAMDWQVGGYLKGGWDLSTQLRLERSTTFVRWDWRRGHLWQVDARGHSDREDELAAAWRLDLMQGDRARNGPVSFEAATRRVDRGRVEWLLTSGSSLAAIGYSVDGRRGEMPLEVDQVGPRFRWWTGLPISEVGHVESNTLLASNSTPGQAPRASLLHDSELEMSFRPAFLVVDLLGYENWLVAGAQEQTDAAGLAGAEMQIAVPLVRRFGQTQGTAFHWIEPLGRIQFQMRPEPTATAQMGLDNVFGRPEDDASVRWDLRAAALAEDAELQRIVASRWGASHVLLGLSGDVGYVKDVGWFSTARARLGRVDKLALQVTLEGRDSGTFRAARWVTEQHRQAVPVDWYATNGWAGSGALTAAITRWLAVGGGIYYDWTANAWLAEHLGAVYRHPCGCLAVSAMGQRRRAREGWDVTAAIDLIP